MQPDRAMKKVSEDEFNILVTHCPDIVKTSGINTKYLNLIVAGHSLGGQIYLPLLGPLHTMEGAATYNHGSYDINGTSLYVSMVLEPRISTCACWLLRKFLYSVSSMSPEKVKRMKQPSQHKHAFSLYKELKARFFYFRYRHIELRHDRDYMRNQTGTAILHISFIYCLPHNREIKRIRLFLLFLSQPFHVFMFAAIGFYLAS